MRYHIFPLLKTGVRYRMLVHRDHQLSYFKDETLVGEIIEVLKRPWYRRIVKWPWFSWEIESNFNDIAYYFWATDKNIGEEIRRKIISEYPEMEIYPVEDEMVQGIDSFITARTMKLDRDYPVKIKTFMNDIVDSQTGLINSISDLRLNEKACIQILLQPATRYQNNFDKALRIIKKWDVEKHREKVELFESSVYSKQTKLLGHCVIRVVAHAENKERATQIVNEMGRSFGQFTSEALNRFRVTEKWMQIKPLLLADWKKRRFPIFEFNRKRVILNIEELSGLMRLPSSAVHDSKLKRLYMKNLEPPREVIATHNNVIQKGPGRHLKIGTNIYKLRETNIYLNLDHLSTHVLVQGGSGSGKTVFLQNLMLDIARVKLEEIKAFGKSQIGFFLIDPHGELSGKLVTSLPGELMDHIAYIRPSPNDKRVFPFNVFDIDFDSTPDSISKNISDVLKRIWPEGWGVRPDRNMLHAGISLQYCGEASIINVNRLFRDFSYCKTIAEQIKDVPEYQEIYDTLSELSEMMDPDANNKAQNRRQHRELTDSTRNKLEQFSLSTLLSKSTGAATCGIRWREWMDEGKITILDLSGIKNSDEKKMYGSMALTMNFQAALTRADLIKNGENLSIYPLIVDELPSFINTNAQVVEDMADKTRYVKVPLIAGAQGLVSQLPEDAANAILRNFNTIISYRVKNNKDALALAANYNHERLNPEDIMRTEENHAYMSIVTGRSSSKAFSALMDPPRANEISDSLLEEIIQKTWEEAMIREEKVKIEKDKNEQSIRIELPMFDEKIFVESEENLKTEKVIENNEQENQVDREDKSPDIEMNKNEEDCKSDLTVTDEQYSVAIESKLDEEVYENESQVTSESKNEEQILGDAEANLVNDEVIENNEQENHLSREENNSDLEVNKEKEDCDSDTNDDDLIITFNIPDDNKQSSKHSSNPFDLL